MTVIAAWHKNHENTALDKFLEEYVFPMGDPHLVADLIAVGGSCHDWQSLSMEVLGASLFTQSIQCVDQLMATRTPACVRDVIPPWSIPVTRTGTVSSFL